MADPAKPGDPLKATRDEVIRALLVPERDEADELGRTPSGDAEDHPTQASPREQAAAPINIQKVDE